MKNEIATYTEFVRPFYSDKDPGHDFSHIQRIINRLDELSKNVTPRPEKHKLFFLASFHGLVSRLEQDKKFNANTRDFLVTNGWKMTEIDEIFISLFRHNLNPDTSEEKIVCDANNAERLGPLGLSKAFITGGARGQSLNQTIEIFENQYLLKVQFHTPVGKRIFEERFRYTQEFLSELKSEL